MIYTIGVRTVSTTVTTAAAEVRSTSAAKPRLMEFGFSQNGAAGGATTYGLGRAAAVGVTPSSPTLAQDEQDGNGPPALTKIATAWGTGPTVPANFARRVSVPATNGAGYVWSFPRGYAIPTSGSIVLWLIAISAGSIVPSDVWAVVDE